MMKNFRFIVPYPLMSNFIPMGRSLYRQQKVLFGGLLLLGFLASCRKDDSNPESLMEQFLSMDSENEQITQFEDDGVEVGMDQRVSLGDASEELSASRCATLTRDTVSNPRRMTIDYGPVNCLCRDGRYRRGVVVIEYTGARGVSGSTASMSFVNYYVNDRGISGNRNLIFGTSTQGNPLRTTQFNLSITHPNRSGTWTRQGLRVREKIAGDSTATLMDDVCLLTGNGSGSNPQGLTFNHGILTPLRKEGACRWLVSGSIQFTRNNQTARTLDFGNGLCDNQATITTANGTRTITLP
jgi:hypothetical protein